MKGRTFTDQNTHCIQVTKMYDWVNLESELKLKERVCLEQPKPFTDIICCDFQIPCKKMTPTTLWTKAGLDHVDGTVSIEYINGCGNPLMVIVNGKVTESLMEGQSFSASIRDLKLVELLCEGYLANVNFCLGEFKITLHYQPEEFKFEIHNVKCFFSDCHGQPLDSCSIICEEISEKRESVYIEKINKPLNKVVVRKKGFITIRFYDKTGNLCKTCTFPFTDIERLLLCAPPGTRLECDNLHCGCEVYMTPIVDERESYIEVSIFLSICQSIQMVAETKIELKGILCEARIKDLLKNSSSN